MATRIETIVTKQKTKLKGKNNYTTQVPATIMELRKEKVAKLINQAPPLNPDDIESNTELVVEKVIEYLSENNEVPDGGFTTSKINGNKAIQRKNAKKEYEEWYELNDVALEIIYNGCESQCQTLIKEDTIAKLAWERLKQAATAMVQRQGHVF